MCPVAGEEQNASIGELPAESRLRLSAHVVGDIAMYRDQPVAHTHLVVGHDDGRTEGGHLLEAHVFPTLEVMVTVDPVAMRKTLDPGTGLALIHPEAK